MPLFVRCIVLAKPAMIDFEVPVKKVIDKEIKKYRGEEVRMCSITLSGDERTIRGGGMENLTTDEAHGKVTIRIEMECNSADVLDELLRAAPDEYVRIKVEELPTFVHPKTGKRVFGREAIDDLLDKIAGEVQVGEAKKQREKEKIEEEKAKEKPKEKEKAKEKKGEKK